MSPLRAAAVVAVLLLPLASTANAASDESGAPSPVSALFSELPWAQARSISLSYRVDGVFANTGEQAALVSDVRHELEAAAATIRPRVRLQHLPVGSVTARHPTCVELNITSGAELGPGGSLLAVDATFFDAPRRAGGGYDLTSSTLRPTAGGAARMRLFAHRSSAPAALPSRAVALLAHEQAARELAAGVWARDRALVLNGEFSEVAIGRTELGGRRLERASLETVVGEAYAGHLGRYAALLAESAYNVRNRYVDAVDRLAEAELGALPAWYDGRAAAGVRRLRATDETVEERAFYTTDGPAWASYWSAVGPRRAAVADALTAFVQHGGALYLEDEACSEEPFAALLPFECEEVPDPARVDLVTARTASKPERTTLGSPLWNRIRAFDDDAVCEPLVVAADATRFPLPLAVRCDLPEGGAVLYSSVHADDLVRDGVVARALLGDGDGAAPSALAVALLEAPLSARRFLEERPDGTRVTADVVDRAVLTFDSGGGSVASAKAGGTPAAASGSRSVPLLVSAGERGFAQVSFRNGTYLAELMSPEGRLVVARRGDRAPLMVDLADRPPGLYELRVTRQAAARGSFATVQHFSTVAASRFAGSRAVARQVFSSQAITIDAFTRGATGLPASAAGQAQAAGGTLVRLALGSEGQQRRPLQIDGHASAEGSDAANLALSLRRTVWAASLVVRLAEQAAGAPCTTDEGGQVRCAEWLKSLDRSLARTSSRKGRAGIAPVERTQELRFGSRSLVLTLRGHGAAEPLAECGRGDEACHLRNRRVSITVALSRPDPVNPTGGGP